MPTQLRHITYITWSHYWQVGHICQKKNIVDSIDKRDCYVSSNYCLTNFNSFMHINERHSVYLCLGMRTREYKMATTKYKFCVPL